jgi:SAM-dependent methyltransferase
MEGLMTTASHPSPYEAPELYDRMAEHFTDDLAFWLDEAKAGAGPVLEVACGTGRVLLHLLQHGIEVDGADLAPAMLERLRAKAAMRNLRPNVVQADMRDFTMPRKYRRVFLAFNGFAHCEEIEDQLLCLRCCREHLEPGGALVIHMSYPSQSYWLGPDGERVLEMELPREGGGAMKMWDTRTKHRVTQRQESFTEIEETDAAGAVVRTDGFEVTQRWVYRFELELLFRTAGFARWDVRGGFAREPLERDDQQMLAFAWRE